MNMNIRSLALWLFLISVVVCAAYGWPEEGLSRIPAGTMLGWDDTNSKYRPVGVDDTGRLTMDAAVTVGSVTVTAGEPADSFDQPEVIVITTPAVITSIANRQDFSVVNHGTSTMFIEIGVATPTSGAGWPVYPGGYFSRDVAESEDVSLSCLSGSTNARIMQGGYKP